MTQVLLVTPEGDLLTLDRAPATKINHSDILYCTDVYSQQRVRQLADQYGTPEIVISDIESTIRPTEIPTFFIPNLYRGFPHWNHVITQQELPEFLPATKCFNFSMNKREPIRTLILRLIEWFGFDNYQYTWSGRGAVEDLSGIVSEIPNINQPWLTQEFKTHILAPVDTIQPRWIDQLEEPDIEQGFRKFSGSPEQQWRVYLPNFIGQTAVSLITDPPENFESNFVFSERWVYTTAALTFNLWVGTHGQAQQAQRMGFDIFDDVINHDYQYYDTVLERCYHALADNWQILTDLDAANTYKSSRKNRLLKNRELMLSNSVAGWIDQQINQMKPAHQTLVREVMNSGIRL